MRCSRYIPDGSEPDRLSGYVYDAVPLPLDPELIAPAKKVLAPQKQHHDPWLEGYNIGNSSLPVYRGLKMILEHDSPYPKNSDDSEAWKQGYRRGFDDLCEIDQFIPDAHIKTRRTVQGSMGQMGFHRNRPCRRVQVCSESTVEV